MGDIIQKGKWKSVEISYYSNGILFINPTDRIVLNLDDLKDYYNYISSIIGGEKVLFLTNIQDYFIDISEEGMAYTANHETFRNMRIASAIVVKYKPNELSADFYVKFFNPKEPTKVFDSIQLAEDWLLERKREHDSKL